LQKIIFLIAILFFFIACGAQNRSPKNNDYYTSEVAEPNVKLLTLPKTISIEFPSALNSLNNVFFSQKIQSIKKLIDIQKKKFKLLEQVIDEISQKCKDRIECHIEANTFRVKENKGSVFLDEIDFFQYPLNEKYQYSLNLKLDKQKSLTFKWSDINYDVLSFYKENNRKLSMHYFSDLSKSKEALYIDDTQSMAKNSLMISFNTNSKNYKLRSNYIDENKAFSSNIVVENKILLEENENIYALNNDFSNVRVGAYLLFSSIEDVSKLNLLELFEKSLGSFIFFETKVQGFIYDNSLIDETLVPFRISAID